LEYSGFDWDEGNRRKCQKHGVSIAEIESLFDGPVVILPDTGHSEAERRFRAIGKTSVGRAVFVVFTQREPGEKMRIRPISARYMHRKEISNYEKTYPQL
jgi:uncharacterized DUF497 family protein